MNIFKNEKFIVANFKQFGTLEQINIWLTSFISEINEVSLNTNIVLCPSFLYLDLFKNKLEIVSETNKKRIFLGSQNISAYTNLENTGEVSAISLSEFVNFSIIGHSERKENPDLVSLKQKVCLENKIVPIVCFYENKEVFKFENSIFAYEDPKAISKDGVYKEKTFDELVGITKELETLFDDMPVLYGGSVTSKNIQTIKDLNFFKGVLIGRASLDPKEFIEIIKILNS